MRVPGASSQSAVLPVIRGAKLGWACVLDYAVEMKGRDAGREEGIPRRKTGTERGKGMGERQAP